MKGLENSSSLLLYLGPKNKMGVLHGLNFYSNSGFFFFLFFFFHLRISSGKLEMKRKTLCSTVRGRDKLTQGKKPGQVARNDWITAFFCRLISMSTRGTLCFQYKKKKKEFKLGKCIGIFSKLSLRWSFAPHWERYSPTSTVQWEPLGGLCPDTRFHPSTVAVWKSCPVSHVENYPTSWSCKTIQQTLQRNKA